MGNDTNKKIELENSLTRDILSEQIIELSDQISSIPEFPKLTEYKSELQTIISKLGNEDILSAISTLEAKIQPVTVESKEIDIMPILEQLKAIQGEMKPLELPEFKFGQNGRLLVSDVGGGGTRAVSVVDSGGDDVNMAKEAKQDDIITELKLKADLTETQPVSNASLPLPAGASTEEKQDTQIANQDFLTNYNISDKETDVATEYFGFVDKDENWYIQRMTATDIRYVAGAGDYATAWTGRAGLSYDYFFNTF